MSLDSSLWSSIRWANSFNYPASLERIFLERDQMLTAANFPELLCII
jgi:hypothetical protein